MNLDSSVTPRERGTQVFADNRYPRRHRWRFDGRIGVDASSSPDVVPLPWPAVADAVAPEHRGEEPGGRPASDRQPRP
jgi:hypothetical protein